MYVGVEDIFTCMEAQSGTGCLSSVFHIDNFRQGLSLNRDFTDQARLAEQRGARLYRSFPPYGYRTALPCPASYVGSEDLMFYLLSHLSSLLMPVKAVILFFFFPL